MIQLTEQELKDLMYKAYNAGWHGMLELCESNVNQITREFMQTHIAGATMSAFGTDINVTSGQPGGASYGFWAMTSVGQNQSTNSVSTELVRGDD